MNRIKEFAGEFARSVAFICERSPLAADRPLRWTVIANTAAGGFTIGKRLLAHRAALEAAVKKAAPMRLYHAEPSLTSRKAGSRFAEYGFYETKAAGNAAMITRDLLEEALSAGSEAENPLFLVLSSGGDGTALEILCEFHKRITAAPDVAAKLRDSFVFLRLPMGTGNDGADAPNLGDALDTLLEARGRVYSSAVRLSTSTHGKGPFYAFNILSAGLDAFVSRWTNRMKGRLPGDSYKLWLDAASLFYSKIHKVGLMDVRVRDETYGPVKHFREKTLLLAVGASGRRTYGAGNRILPDDRNVCMMREMPVLRKIAIKGLVARGEHGGCPEVRLFSARRVEFTCEYPILAQTDGETVLLEPSDFPAAIDVSEPLVPLLSRTPCKRIALAYGVCYSPRSGE
ncbi:MAG: diacylglycerol kinase [Spirochaetaceae bacterium]|jgi:diacylglycerol kinase family enzyme|nr:diacylglycerol kinase [Spirochaetaceae bacterium]